MEEKPAPLKSARVRHPTARLQKYFTNTFFRTSGALTDITKEETLQRVADGRKTRTLEKNARVRHPTGHIQKYFTNTFLRTSGVLTDITKEEALQRVTDGRKTRTLEKRKGAAPNCSPSEVFHE
jgi:hypothetical protein